MKTELEIIELLQQNTDVTYMIRSGLHKRWAIYKPLGNNRAKIIYESNDDNDCRRLLKTAHVSYV